MSSAMTIVKANARYRQILAEKERLVNAFNVDPNDKHRATTKVVKMILLYGPYKIKGRLYEIKAKSLGAGVYELSAEEK